MIALVLVSHSRALALALKETLEKLYGGKTPPIAVAAGIGEGGEELGTDATAIMAAIEEVGATANGVLVLLDLGSAVLSAEMALELLDEPLRGKAALCAAPLVEGAIAAAAQSSIGATLAEVRAEAEGALRQKIEHLGVKFPTDIKPAEPPGQLADDPSLAAPVIAKFRVENPHGLHARPAMRIVQTVAPFSSTVHFENLRLAAPPASARSLVALTCLDAQTGDTMRVTVRGADAAEVVRALEILHASQFGDLAAGETKTTPPAIARKIPVMPSLAETSDPHRLLGRPLSEGIAIGPLFFAEQKTITLSAPPTVVDPQTEIVRLHSALAAVQGQLKKSVAELSARVGRENAAILEAQQMLAADLSLLESALAMIQQEHLPATHAWQRVSQLTAESYRRLEQPLLRERAQDVEDLCLRVLRALGDVTSALPLGWQDTPFILAVPTLLPSEVVALDLQKVLGVIAENIGPTSHAAILLRAAGVAAVEGVDLGRLMQSSADPKADVTVALDGGTGEVWLEPDDAIQREIEERQRQQSTSLTSVVHAQMVSKMLDGQRVELAVNVNSVADATAAARAGAETIGLLRTEFLFFDRAEPPSEDEQTQALQNIAAAMPPNAPVTVRTFDIGGDKPVPYLPVPPEVNPFLGMRGLRLALIHRELLITHFRAILRAAHGHRFRVMFPMVTEVEEIRLARALLTGAHEGLTREGIIHAWPVEVGMMVEVPAAALNAHNFVSEVDFFSIGTNDLTQYTLAAERGHMQLTNFADALHPAVLRLIRRVAAIALRHQKWVGVCGEAAADPVAAGVFIGLGVQELSVGVAALGRLRQLITTSEYVRNRIKARRCLKAASGEEVRRLWRS